MDKPTAKQTDAPEASTETVEEMTDTFRVKLEKLINRYSVENGSNTPDHILADYLMRCIQAFDEAVNHREVWYGRTVSEIKGL